MIDISPEKWELVLSLLNGLSLAQWKTISYFVNRQYDGELGKTQLPDPLKTRESLDWNIKFN